MAYNHLRTIVREEGTYDIMDDTAHTPATNKPLQLRGFAASLALVGLLVSVGVLAAGCGGGSKGPGAASLGATTTVATSGSSGSDPAGESIQAEQLQFAQCMRSHGVPNYPDPSANGGTLNALSAAGINTHTPAFHSALQACKQYNPSANLTPAQSAAENAKGLAMSQCMRSHGVPNFPDPSIGPLGEQVMNLHGTGIDMNSPAYQAAASACQKLFPGSK